MNPFDFWPNGLNEPEANPNIPENEEQAFVRAACGCASYIMILLLLALFCLLSGCTTTRYVEVPGPSHTDTVRITKHTRDSIYLSDSIYVNDFIRDDTVYKTIERWRTKYIERTTHDTLYQSKVDSIPYPVEVIKEVPAELSWWQQLKMKVGGAAIILCLLAFLIWVWRTK